METTSSTLMETETLEQDLLYFNGINGASGQYLLPPLSAPQIAAMTRGEPLDPTVIGSLKTKARRASMEMFGAAPGIDTANLAETGWGVIFPHGVDPGIREALAELLDLRKEQASGRRAEFYREFSGADGYRPGDSAQEFLQRQGIDSSMPADPGRGAPYYLLIVGDPEQIPYKFQCQLDVQYAVGRIWFDTLEEYAQYARSVVMAEKGQVHLPRRAALFGVQNPGDRPTELSTSQLVSPLAADLPRKLQQFQLPTWTIDAVLGEAATKARLGSLLGGNETPALLFTASHGMGFPNGDPLQFEHQGALLCQDWPGPLSRPGSISRDHYFSAEDISQDASLLGLIAFHFACFGAGTPRLDDFAHRSSGSPAEIAPHAFISKLPRRMLGHPKGGALAVIGHVERAWGYSFSWGQASSQTQSFEATLLQVMRGLPVGLAVDYFNGRYAALATQLSAELERLRFDGAPDDPLLAGLWTAHNDARSYVILGDPAVRLPLGTADESNGRPAIDPIVLNTTPSTPSSDGNGRASTFKPDEGQNGQPGGLRLQTAETPTNTVEVTIPLRITVSLGSVQTALPGSLMQDLASPVPSPPVREEAVSIDPDYDSREGYDPEFLGTGDRQVSLPRLSADQRRDATRLIDVPPGADRHELKYHHYSVVMHRRRRLAFFTAVNIDGKKAREVTREDDKWFFDPRISRDEQVSNDLYFDNDFDRGHLVRRLDPAWGRTFQIAKVANDDTFHWTNSSPQHKRFNQGHNLWQGVENYLLDRATDSDERLTVFTGPVFRDDDPEYRGIQIPLEYWKVAVLVGADGQLKSLGFIVTQEDLVGPVVMEGAVDTARLFQTSVAEIAELTELDFGTLLAADVGTVDVFAAGQARERIPLTNYEQIRLPNAASTESSFAPAPAEIRPAGSASAKESVPGTDLSYYLLAYDAEGRERTDHPAGLISRRILRELATAPVTDLFLFSHGWQGDVPSAREQYQGWLRAMAACEEDRQRIRQVRPGFRPLLVGIHWPSLPWGDERLAAELSFAPGQPAPEVERVVDEYAAVLGESEEIRTQLRTIVKAAREEGEPEQLPEYVLDAYRNLDAAVALPKGGLGSAPGADWEGFDPEGIYQKFRSDVIPPGGVSFGLFDRDTLLAPLRSLSFWRMKDRARQIGEHAVHSFLRQLQGAADDRDVRIHLTGHSFGCIVTSSAIVGLPGGPSLSRPVDSLVLLQGALSHWGYCSNIPEAPGTPGYFHRLISRGLVRGPIVSTQSRHDTAVGTWYPRAAQVAGQVAFAPREFPKYGAIGAFGLQGPGIRIQELRMQPAGGEYEFRPGHVYNLESSQFINVGGGFSGAHSDIRKAPVAHALWTAIANS